MAVGYFIRPGDRTSCGGRVLGSNDCTMVLSLAHSREGDYVTCGQDGKSYLIVGGMSLGSRKPSRLRAGGRLASTLDSVSSCPCQATLIASSLNNFYEFI